MSRNSVSPSATEMRSGLSSFLTRNLNNLELGWPRIGSGDGRERREPPAMGPTVGLKVLFVGELTLELPVEVEATTAQLSSHLTPLQKREKRVAGQRGWRLKPWRAVWPGKLIRTVSRKYTARS